MASLDIGRTFSRAAGLIGGSLGSVGVFLAGVQVVTAVEQYFVAPRMAALTMAARPVPGGDPLAPLAMFTSPVYWGGTAFSLLASAFAMAGAIGGMQRLAAGKSVTAGDCVSIGFARVLPMLALTVLWMLGLIAGFMLLLVPGFILLAMWAVASPVLVAEDVSIAGAFGRSRVLTKGSRGKILLMLLIVGILLMVASATVSAGTGLQSFGRPLPGAAQPFGPVRLVGTFVIGLGFGMVIDALLTAMHIELDDGAGGQLAEVFS